MPSYSSSEDTEVELQQAYGDEANPRVEDDLVVVEDKTGDAGDNLKVIQYSILNNNNNSKKNCSCKLGGQARVGGEGKLAPDLPEKRLKGKESGSGKKSFPTLSHD